MQHITISAHVEYYDIGACAIMNCSVRTDKKSEQYHLGIEEKERTKSDKKKE